MRGDEVCDCNEERMKRTYRRHIEVLLKIAGTYTDKRVVGKKRKRLRVLYFLSSATLIVYEAAILHNGVMATWNL